MLLRATSDQAGCIPGLQAAEQEAVQRLPHAPQHGRLSSQLRATAPGRLKGPGHHRAQAGCPDSAAGLWAGGCGEQAESYAQPGAVLAG